MSKKSAFLIVTIISITATFFVGTVSCRPVSSPTVSSPSQPTTSSPLPTTVVPIEPAEGQEPIEVLSVLGPLPPINPGGPIVEITLKNVAKYESVISLTAALEAGRQGRPFVFLFDAQPANPLLPGQTTSRTLTLIGGGFSSELSYPLTIDVTLQDGKRFVYTEQVRFVHP